MPYDERWAGTRKVKPIWILLKQETVSTSRTGAGPVWTPSARQTGRWTVLTARHGDTRAADAGPRTNKCFDAVG